jgi:2'-5' RNA ligase
MSLAMPPVGKGYAIWLMPEEPMFSLLAGEISRLSREHSTPRFDPHVTLVGGITLPEEDALAASASLAGLLKPFRMELGTVGYLDEYFRCLFIRVLSDDAITKAHQAACRAFGLTDTPYMPHVSVIYGKLRLDTKKRIAKGLGSLSGRMVKVRHLLLYRVSGPLHEWKRAERFDLK